MERLSNGFVVVCAQAPASAPDLQVVQGEPVDVLQVSLLFVEVYHDQEGRPLLADEGHLVVPAVGVAAREIAAAELVHGEPSVGGGSDASVQSVAGALDRRKIRIKKFLNSRR